MKGCLGLEKWSKWELTADGYGVSSYDDANVLESDNGHGCTTL